ncbi:MAG: sigma-70 family RNA polymerase sigma factor [Alphaproteobacteria bacterium]
MFYAHDLIQEMDGLRGFAYLLTGNRSDADDLLQSTVLRALEKEHLFEKGTDLFKWCSKIMFNIFAGQYRRRVKFESMYDPDPVIERQARPANQYHHMRCSEVGEAMEGLNKKHRRVLVDICVNGMKYQTVADNLGVPVGTVRSRLFRAREQLAALLDDTSAHAA